MTPDFGRCRKRRKRKRMGRPRLSPLPPAATEAVDLDTAIRDRDIARSKLVHARVQVNLMRQVLQDLTAMQGVNLQRRYVYPDARCRDQAKRTLEICQAIENGDPAVIREYL